MVGSAQTLCEAHQPSVQSSRHDSEVYWEVLAIGEALAMRYSLLRLTLSITLPPLNLPPLAHLSFARTPFSIIQFLLHFSSPQPSVFYCLLSLGILSHESPTCVSSVSHFIHCTAHAVSQYTVSVDVHWSSRWNEKLRHERNITCLRALRLERFRISCHIKRYLFVQPRTCLCCHLWELSSSESGPAFLTLAGEKGFWERIV